MDRFFRVNAWRLTLALLFVLTSAAINPALARQTGSGTPPATTQAEETTPESTVAATEAPAESPTAVPPTEVPVEPTIEPTAEPTDVPATEAPTEPPISIPTETAPASTPDALGIQALEEETSTVTLTVRSTRPSIARALPTGASWSLSFDSVVVENGVFPSQTLPQAIELVEALPYGVYELSIDAGPIFQPFTATYTVDEAAEGIDAALAPVTDSAVSITVTSSNPSIANTLPVNATWSVSSGGVPVDSDTFAADDLALPAAIPVTNRVPFGSYDVTVSAGPTFRPYSATFVVDNVTESFSIVLLPFTWTDVSFTASSSDPSVDNTLPSGATWSIRTPGGVVLAQGAYGPDNLDLPATIDVVPLIPFGTYQIAISAGPQFNDFSGTFVFNSTSELFNITLIPNDASFITQLIAQLIAILTAILAGQA